MIRKFLIPLFLLILLCGCTPRPSAEIIQATTVPEDLTEIGISSYFCTTDQKQISGNIGTVTAAFTHSIYTPNQEFLTGLNVTVTGSFAEDSSNITSLRAKLSGESRSGITISEHLSGDIATVILYLNQLSVCHLQYRLTADGTVEFLS